MIGKGTHTNQAPIESSKGTQTNIPTQRKQNFWVAPKIRIRTKVRFFKINNFDLKMTFKVGIKVKIVKVIGLLTYLNIFSLIHPQKHDQKMMGAVGWPCRKYCQDRAFKADVLLTKTKIIEKDDGHSENTVIFQHDAALLHYTQLVQQYFGCYISR